MHKLGSGFPDTEYTYERNALAPEGIFARRINLFRAFLGDFVPVVLAFQRQVAWHRDRMIV
jgi:hypothetical protein